VAIRKESNEQALKLRIDARLNEHYHRHFVMDVNKVGDSRYINEGIDRLLVSWEAGGYQGMSMYAGSYDHKHAYVSPVYRSFEGFPPSYFISGTRDLMSSDTVRVHRKLRALTPIFMSMKASRTETMPPWRIFQSRMSTMRS
jgi:hypothetical protein